MENNLQFLGKSRILEAIRGHHIYKTLKAAIKIELFTLLEPKPLTGEEIKNQLKVEGRGFYDFLDALVSIGILNRDGDGVEAHYGNTAEGSLFLVNGRPQYMGGWFEFKMKEIEQSWDELAEALKTGKPQRHDMKSTGKRLFEATYDSKGKTQAFVGSMNFAQMSSFKDFSVKFDFSGFHTMCDIGGANGLLSILVARQNPHLKIITFDLPVMESLAREKIETAGLSDRITVVSGNFFSDDFPRAEVITMGNILHDWDLSEKKQLMAKAYNALPPGGALVAIESLIDEGRRKNTAGLLMSLQMLLVTEGGFDFTAGDFSAWARETGFKDISNLELSGDSNAVIAYK